MNGTSALMQLTAFNTVCSLRIFLEETTEQWSLVAYGVPCMFLQIKEQDLILMLGHLRAGKWKIRCPILYIQG